MSITRREFLLGTAAGLIIPSWYEKALAYCENHGEPFLEKPPIVRQKISAIDWGDGGFELALGDPFEQPPQMTWRQFKGVYFPDSSESEFMVDWCQTEPVWEELVPIDTVLEFWYLQHSPNAKAFRLLKTLDLGNSSLGEPVGQLEFIEGQYPGHLYRAAHAPTLIDLSLLQRKLVQLGMGIQIDSQFG